MDQLVFGYSLTYHKKELFRLFLLQNLNSLHLRSEFHFLFQNDQLIWYAWKHSLQFCFNIKFCQYKTDFTWRSRTHKWSSTYQVFHLLLVYFTCQWTVDFANTFAFMLWRSMFLQYFMTASTNDFFLRPIAASVFSYKFGHFLNIH